MARQSTHHYAELVTFYRDAMGLKLDHEERDFAVFKLPDGSKVEVFGPSDEDHLHFDTGPVGGFGWPQYRQRNCAGTILSPEGGMWPRR